MAIKNVEQLREYILESLDKLRKNKMDIDEASIIAKSGEVIMSSVKLQMAYSHMLNHTPHIKFLHDCHDGKPVKKEIDIK